MKKGASMKGKRRFIAVLLSLLMVMSQMSVAAFAVDAVAPEGSDKAVTEEAAPEKEEPAEEAFDQSETVDGVKVTVRAEEGVFPAGSKLSVGKVSVPSAVDTEDAAKTYAYDISILADGEETQPEGEAKVYFSAEEVADYDTAVYHMDGDEAEELDVTEKGKTAAVKTDGFSVYVVKFTLESVETTYSMSEGDTVKVRDILGGVTGQIFTGAYDTSVISINEGPDEPVVAAVGEGTTTISGTYGGHGPGEGTPFSISVTVDELVVDPLPEGAGVIEQTGEALSLLTNYEAVKTGLPEGYEMRYRTKKDGKWTSTTSSTDEPKGTDAAQYEVFYQLYFGEQTVEGEGFSGSVNAEIAEPHVHDWKIERDSGTDDKATVSCQTEGCPFHDDPILVTISTRDQYVDKEFKLPEVTYENRPEELEDVVRNGKFWYSTKEGGYNDWTDKVPDKAGEYAVKTSVFAGSVSKPVTSYFELMRYDPEWTRLVVPAEGDALVTDGKTPVKLIVKDAASTSDGQVMYGLVTYVDGKRKTVVKYNPDPETIKCAEAGDYQIWYKVDPTEIYEGLDTVVVPVTISSPVTVLFDSNGGEGTMKPQTVPSGVSTPLDKNAFEKRKEGEALKFFAWNTDKDAKVPSDGQVPAGDGWYEDGDDITIDSTVRLYAIWQEYAHIKNPPRANELTYNSNEQELITDGSVVKGQGTMVYSLEKDGEYSQALPTGKKAGDYTVWYKVEGENGYADLAPQKMTVTISKKAATATDFEAEDKPYDGTTDARLAVEEPGPGIIAYIDERCVGDELYVASANAEFENADPGTNKKVLITDITLGGADAANYELTSTTAEARASITHEHVWDVTSKDGVATITCTQEKCPYHDEPIHVYLKVRDDVYNGDLHPAVLDTSEIPEELEDELTVGWTTDPEDAKVYYKKGSAAGSPEIPVDAAKYKAYTRVRYTDSNGKPANKAVTAEFRINRRPVTVSGITAEDKAYDGTETASLDISKAVLDGKLAGSDLDIAVKTGSQYNTGAFEDSSVGKNKKVTWGELLLTGDDASNYMLAEDGQQTEASASITALEVKVAGITAEDKAYDGNTDAAVVTENATFEGKLPADELTVSTTGTFDNANAGKDKTVTFGELVLGGAAAGNYSISAESQKETKASITQKSVVVSGVRAENHVYDGTYIAQLDIGNAKLSGLVGEDEVFIKQSTYYGLFQKGSAEERAQDAGINKTVKIYPDSFILDGDDADNYSIDKEKSQTSTRADILPLEVKLAWQKSADDTSTDLTYEYNAEKQAPYAKVTNLVTILGVTDKCDVTVSGAKTDAGDYTARAAKLSNPNYRLPENDREEDFTITQKPVVITWQKDPIFTYNGEEQLPEVTISTGLEGDDTKLYAEIEASESITPEGHVPGIDAGGYVATVTEISEKILGIPVRSKNFTLKGAENKTTGFLILPKMVTVEWEGDGDDPCIYDGETHYVTAEIDGTVEGETLLPVYDGVQSEENAGEYEGKVTGIQLRDGDKSTKVDNYLLVKEIPEPGESPEYITQEHPSVKAWEIFPREITIRWPEKTSYVYNGKTQTVAPTFDDVVEGDNVVAEYGAGSVTSAKDVGSYEGKVIGIKAGDKDTVIGNYDAIFSSGAHISVDKPSTFNWSISKAELTVKATNQSIYYGSDYDKSKVTYSGWQGKDDESVLTKPAEVDSDYFVNAIPGNYTLTPGGAAAKNYTFKYTDGALTVKQKTTVLVAQALASGKDAGNISWNKITGASKYEVYFDKSSPKKVAVVTGNKYTVTGLEKGVTYRCYVTALDANGKRLAKSSACRFIAGGYNDTYTNVKKMTVSPSTVSLKVGGKKTLTVTQTGANSTKQLYCTANVPLLTYKTDNKNVATVDSNGVITATGAGYCVVYVQAVDGLWRSVSVVVEDDMH